MMGYGVRITVKKAELSGFENAEREETLGKAWSSGLIFQNRPSKPVV